MCGWAALPSSGVCWRPKAAGGAREYGAVPGRNTPSASIPAGESASVRVFKSLIRSLRRERRRAAEVADPGFVDVKRLIAELSDEELMHSADQYFAKMTLASEQCLKPFSNPSDAVYLTRHLGLVLEAADLMRGARVLDFGCATGWLTLGLAQMGCHAVGVDISPAALKLAEGQKAAPTARPRRGTAEFHVYDGVRLPLADASLDRVVCFDAFHHVKDQRATLMEFARVLKPGGRAAFMEPGPEHSRTPLSQAEMSMYKVIENDVSMEAIAGFAAEAGFDEPQMLVQFQGPFTVAVGEFNEWARDGLPLRRVAAVKQTLERQLTNGQCFYMQKGSGLDDSRRPDGLAAELTLRSASLAPLAGRAGVRLEIEVRNSGRRHWLRRRGPGQVNVGVHVLAASGAVISNDHARLALPAGDAAVAPGEALLVHGTVPLPAGEDMVLRLDLVAELVTWFADQGGTQPLRVVLKDLRRGA